MCFFLQNLHISNSVLIICHHFQAVATERCAHFPLAQKIDPKASIDAFFFCPSNFHLLFVRTIGCGSLKLCMQVKFYRDHVRKSEN